MPLLEVDGLSVDFGARRVLDDVGFSVEPGRRLGIVGESGSGKTLCALAIMGLLPCGARRGGRIRFAGADLPEDEVALATLRGRHLGMVFQEPMSALNPLHRVGAQIAEAMAPADGAAVGNRVASMLEDVGLDARHAERFPHQLSGGQCQRALIAIALAGAPELVIADEPTSALDVIVQRHILNLIDRLCRSRGTALVFISHDLRAVASLCDDVLVMQRGRMVETGSRDEIFGAPRTGYTRSLVESDRAAQRPHDTSPPDGKPLLVARGLGRHYRRGLIFRHPPFVALAGVDFTVGAHEAVAVVGPSGSGKTTLARIIAGLDSATAGDMVFDGVAYRGRDLPRRLRPAIGLVFQDPFGSFDPRIPIGRSIGEALRGLPPDEIALRVGAMVAAVGLASDMLGRYPHEFSGGQRQRFAIARALVTRPRLVVLDEPVSALDVTVRAEVMALLKRLRAELELALIIVSHDLDMVADFADRVLVMEKGHIVESGPPRTLFETPRTPLTKALLAARLPPLALPRAETP